MAQAVISDKSYGQIKSAKTGSFGVFKAMFKPISSTIKNVGNNTKLIKSKSYPLSSISYQQVNVKVAEVLPFRVKFTTIGIDAYGPGNPAPIGIAVIGINNYIL